MEEEGGSLFGGDFCDFDGGFGTGFGKGGGGFVGDLGLTGFESGEDAEEIGGCLWEVMFKGCREGSV